MVSVHAFGVLDNVTFTLMFEVFKPEAQMQDGDTYKSKPKIGIDPIDKIAEFGFKTNLVLADCEYGDKCPLLPGHLRTGKGWSLML